MRSYSLCNTPEKPWGGERWLGPIIDVIEFIDRIECPRTSEWREFGHSLWVVSRHSANGGTIDRKSWPDTDRSKKLGFFEKKISKSFSKILCSQFLASQKNHTLAIGEENCPLRRRLSVPAILGSRHSRFHRFQRREPRFMLPVGRTLTDLMGSPSIASQITRSTQEHPKKVNTNYRHKWMRIDTKLHIRQAISEQIISRGGAWWGPAVHLRLLD